MITRARVRDLRRSIAFGSLISSAAAVYRASSNGACRPAATSTFWRQTTRKAARPSLCKNLRWPSRLRAQLTIPVHRWLVEFAPMVRVVRATQVETDTALQALRDGDLVAFPTETVYGLGPNSQNPAAVRKIFAAKGRPVDHPVIVHLDSPRFLHRWVREVPEAANKLAERFWPGPLTMVMPRAANVHDVVTGGQDTVAIRVPSHPMAQQLLTAFGGGIAAPSANRYGRLSPTRAEHVRDELGDSVNTILDGGETQIGLESTIITVEGPSVRLLRPGAVTAGQIRTVIGDELLI